ncbi:MAG: DUF4345 family protein [Candidatus Devosia symbiotica]|nr:DUF4345 family protein [Candidatus Devosia symbiotica]
MRIVLALTSAGITFLGRDLGLSGMRTLGWQEITDFIDVTDAAHLNIQNSHARFVGGVWLGVGLLFLASAAALDRLCTTLIALCGLIVVDGLMRLVWGDLEDNPEHEGLTLTGG